MRYRGVEQVEEAGPDDRSKLSARRAHKLNNPSRVVSAADLWCLRCEIPDQGLGRRTGWRGSSA